MGRMQASKYAGPGSLTNSTVTAKRRWATEQRTKLAAGTNVATFTQGQTLLASIETIMVHVIPSFANNVATGSMDFHASMTSGNTLGTGTVTFYAHGKTLNHVVRLHCLFIGPPDINRDGS